ncbi:MAG: flagellar M-ring protein FliF, partial [Tabrizicola sp.]
PPATPTAPVALTGEVDDALDYGEFAGVGRSALADAGDGAQEDPATRLRRLIEQRQTESIEILRGWMEHDEEHV